VRDDTHMAQYASASGAIGIVAGGN